MILSSFPRIPHLPGSHASREDLLLDDEGARRFFTSEVVVVEKLDGLNVTFELSSRGRIAIALKSEWRGALAQGVGRSLDIWVRQREDALRDLLEEGTLYGEWMRHRVHVDYDALPDALIGIALFRRRGGFAPFGALSRLLTRHGFTPPRALFRGVLGEASRLKALVGRSSYGRGKMEGVVVEILRDPSEHRFAKWVDPDYTHPEKGVVVGKNRIVASPEERGDEASREKARRLARRSRLP